MFLQKRDGLDQGRNPGLFQLVHDDGCGHVHAVQHVAHVVEDAGRHFRHASLAGRLH